MLPKRFTILVDRYKNNQLNQEEMAELRLAVLSGLNDDLFRDDILLTLTKQKVHDRWSQKMENEVWKNVVAAIRMMLLIMTNPTSHFTTTVFSFQTFYLESYGLQIVI